MAKAVKLADIAERVGVSTVTVSKALSGQKGVSEEVREKIHSIAEELGYIGVVLALLMVFFVAFRAMSIGRKALEIDHRFSGFLACSIGIWFSFQALVNVGAAAGMLPTKGLTLPLISYGGSSLLIMSTAIMLLLRIDYETRLEKAQAFTRGSR